MSGLAQRDDRAYYTVADSTHFAGAVALFDSLRALGELAPVYLVDCGLTESQRERLKGHITLVPPHKDLHPSCQKATGPMAHPAEVMVVVDADILVTRAFDPLIERARQGQIVGFEDFRLGDRFFEEWSVVGLGEPRRRPYINAGQLVFSAEIAAELLPRLVELEEQLSPTDTHYGGGVLSNPFFFADQDVLNAMFCTTFWGRVETIEARLAPFTPFPGLGLVEPRSVAYADGVTPYVLHHVEAKPWLAPLIDNVYSRLFTSFATASDAPVRLEKGDLPLRLSASRLAPVDRLRVSLQHRFRRHFRGKLGIRSRVDRRLAAGRRRGLPAGQAEGPDLPTSFRADR
jgi:hypothetical protein